MLLLLDDGIDLGVLGLKGLVEGDVLEATTPTKKSF